MTEVKTQPLESSKSLEDEVRLRELEFWRDSLKEKVDKVDKEVCGLKTRLTIIITLVLGQLAEAPQLLGSLLVY